MRQKDQGFKASRGRIRRHRCGRVSGRHAGDSRAVQPNGLRNTARHAVVLERSSGVEALMFEREAIQSAVARRARSIEDRCVALTQRNHLMMVAVERQQFPVAPHATLFEQIVRCASRAPDLFPHRCIHGLLGENYFEQASTIGAIWRSLRPWPPHSKHANSASMIKVSPIWSRFVLRMARFWCATGASAAPRRICVDPPALRRHLQHRHRAAARLLRIPGTPGHEFVGEVLEADDRRWVGERVVGEINLACGKCARCARGLGRHCPTRDRCRADAGVQLSGDPHVSARSQCFHRRFGVSSGICERG